MPASRRRRAARARAMRRAWRKTLASVPRDLQGLHRLVQQNIALCLSLGTHATVFLVGVLIYAGTAPPARHMIATAATAVASLDAAGVAVADSLALTDDTQSLPQMAMSESTAAAPSSVALLDRMDEYTDDESVIGLGPRDQLLSWQPWDVDPSGAPKVAAFGISGSEQAAASPFAAPGASARRIVFLCDASGSMIPNFFNVRQELASSIKALRQWQSFNIIFFKLNRAYAMDSAALRMATETSKQAAAEFAAGFAPEGRTDPLPGIRAAFALQPDMICVITDGFDNAESLASIMDEFRTQNRFAKVSINTVLIRGSDDPQLEQALRQIAEENGGAFKAIQNQ